MTVNDLPYRLSGRIVVQDDGCWKWPGGQNSSGYGQITWKGHQPGVHRVVYELLVGPIPDGLEIDHLCRFKMCVNPAHLEPVTHAENMRRRAETTTHCKHGHEFNEGNTYVTAGGHRQCKTCQQSRQREAAGRYLAEGRIPHGTYTGYSYGCRCEECRSAHRSYRMSMKGREPSSHGATGYTTYGCRCDVCRSANRERGRSLKGRTPPAHGASGYTNYACRCDICKTAGAETNRNARKRRLAREQVSS